MSFECFWYYLLIITAFPFHFCHRIGRNVLRERTRLYSERTDNFEAKINTNLSTYANQHHGKTRLRVSDSDSAFVLRPSVQPSWHHARSRSLRVQGIRHGRRPIHRRLDHTGPQKSHAVWHSEKMEHHGYRCDRNPCSRLGVVCLLWRCQGGDPGVRLQPRSFHIRNW